MNERVEIRIADSARYAEDVARFVLDMKTSRWPLLVLVVLLAVVAARIFELPWPAVVGVGGSAAIIVVSARRRNRRKLIDQLTRLMNGAVISIDEDGIKIITTESSGTVLWKAIDAIEESERLIALRRGDLGYIFLPKSSDDSNTTVSIKQLITAHTNLSIEPVKPLPPVILNVGGPPEARTRRTILFTVFAVLIVSLPLLLVSIRGCQ